MDYKEMLEASLKAARDIAQKASIRGRNLTPTEAGQVNEHPAKADEVPAKLKEIEASDALVPSWPAWVPRAVRRSRMSGAMAPRKPPARS